MIEEGRRQTTDAALTTNEQFARERARQIQMGQVIITVQMSADASTGPNIGWFEGGEQEDPVEDEDRLVGAAGPRR